MTPDPKIQSCGLFRRFMCMLYDGLLILALLIVAAGIAWPLTGDDQRAGQDFFYTSYLLLVWFTYLGWCWSHSGQTLGMRAWKVQLESNKARRPGWKDCGVRFFVSLLSMACLGLGFLVSLFRSDRACWHDLASSTRLVRINPD